MVDFAVEEEDQATRDRSKNTKFKSPMKSGLLPEWFVNQWNKSLSMKAGRVDTQRKLVNLAIRFGHRPRSFLRKIDVEHRQGFLQNAQGLFLET